VNLATDQRALEAPDAGALDAGPEPEDRAAPVEVLSGRWLAAAVVFVGLVVTAGVVLRFWTRSAMWLDEALTVNIARLPLHQIPGALKRDGAPPLYYVLLHFWMKVFGSSDVGARSLSGVISVATLPVAWLAARRFAGRTAAWVVLILLASSPFAVYYATEVRMYSLVMLLTACGVLALQRALEHPRPGNLVATAAVTGLLLYSQYWALYLVAAAVVWLVLLWWRGRAALRANARWVLGAIVVGIITFLPWVPTFYFQSRHTGTPWAPPANYSAIINAITGFTDNQATNSSAGSNQGRLLAIFYFLLAFLAVFGAARDRYHVELDIRTRRPSRGMAFVVFATLAAAVTGGLLTSSAFSPRYASVVYVPLLLLVGLGALTLIDVRVRTAIMAIAAVAGLALAVENVWTPRTQAPGVARVLDTEARPGDLVAFCPDQLGPSVARLVAPGRLQMTTFPRGTPPTFVDWVDYKAAAQAESPAAFARRLVQAAGSTHRIWAVWAPGYQGLGTRCEQMVSALLGTPGFGVRNWVTFAPKQYYEPMELTQFVPPRTPSASSGGSATAAP
jgi:hypothetical protein